jgi:MFS family permease
LANGFAKTYVRFLIVFGFGVGAAAASPNVWVATVAMMLCGFGNGGAVVANITLVQRAAADDVRGRAFTLLMSASYAMLGLGYALAGPLTNAVGPRWDFALAAWSLIAAAGCAWLFMRRISEAELGPVPDIVHVPEPA